MDENREERFYDLLEADENDAEAQYQMLLSPAGARAVTAKMRKIQCGFSAFLQSFCIIFCIFAYPFVILSVFPGANLPVTT